MDIKTFDAACLKFQVNFTREELRKIKNLFCVNETAMQTINDSEVINFTKMSHQLGLHRDSYNYLTNSCRSKSLSKIKQFYRSIEPVEEEPEEPAAEPTKQLHKKNKSIFQQMNKTYVAQQMRSSHHLTEN